MRTVAILIALGALLSGCGSSGGGGNSSGAQGSSPSPQGDSCLRQHALLKNGGAFGDSYGEAVAAFSQAVVDCGATKETVLVRAREMLVERYGQGEIK